MQVASNRSHCDECTKLQRRCGPEQSRFDTLYITDSFSTLYRVYAQYRVALKHTRRSDFPIRQCAGLCSTILVNHSSKRAQLKQLTLQ